MYSGGIQPQPGRSAAPREPRETQVNATSDVFEPGQFIEGRYKVISLLGRGGMGAVYLVEQIFLHKYFALKTLSSENITEKNVMRFQKEAQAAGGLDHPGLTKVHDFGTINHKFPFFVMDYIEGESLSDRIRRGPLPVDEALPILIKSALALAHAHDKGIVHRDLKPSNIMLTLDAQGERCVKLVDFGIAKFIYGDSDDIQALTKTGEIFGSPFYMSPEQCMGLAVDNRSDIYSFGCLMFETLTGNPPFLGDTALATMLRHQNEIPMTLKEATLGHEFPPALERIVARLLEKDPGRRYQDLFALASDLENVRRGTFDKQSETATQVFGIKIPVVKHKVDYLPIALAVLLVLAVSSVSFMAGRQSKPAEVITKKVEDVSEDSLTLLKKKIQLVKKESSFRDSNDKSALAVAGASQDPNSEYYSDARVFAFPVKVEIGKIYAYKQHPADSNIGLTHFLRNDGVSLGTGWDGKSCVGVRAIGTVVVQHFSPIGLRLGHVFIDPSIFERFREDELAEIDMRQAPTLDNDSWKYIFRFKGLKSLTTSPLMNSIEPANHLSQLEILNVGRSRINGAQLAKLRRLKQLVYLDCSVLENVSSVLAVLADSRTIKSLFVRESNLHDASLANIAKLPNLEELDISENPLLTKAGLSKLSALKHLKVFQCTRIRTEPRLAVWLKERLPPTCRVEVVEHLNPVVKLDLNSAADFLDEVKGQ